ncbi:MAG TPA: protoporphyrinogen oxidase [Planctomycetaceae bacterium]|nr:protoporphyrinogen oxidase [Planctomycetaceae bacterium]
MSAEVQTLQEQPAGRSDRPARVAVIGGGLSGLAAAHRMIELAAASRAQVRVELFEAGPRLGGAIWTERVGECLAELGADSFITNKPAAIELCRRLGLEDRLIATESAHRQALVLRRGKPVPIPEGFMLMAPGRIWPVLASPIFSPWGKLRMGLEYLIPRRTDSADESVASFVRRRLGTEALDRLVQPLVAGIYTSDPEKLSLAATLPRFIEMERRHGSLIRAARAQRRAAEQSTAGNAHESGARYGLFASLRGGMSELTDALVGRIESAGAIHRNTGIRALRRSSEADGGFVLETGDGRQHAFDVVILALPANRAAGLLESIDRDLSASLGEIEYVSSAIVVTGHHERDIEHPLNASGLVIPAVEGRQILSVSFASRKFAGRAPAGEVVLRTFVGGALQPELLQRSDEELTRLVRSELGDILGVRGEPTFVRISRHDGAMPQYHIGHRDRVTRIKTLLAGHPRLALAGNAYEGVGIPDCVQSGETAAERVFNALVPARSLGAS